MFFFRIKRFPECCQATDDNNQTPLHVACQTGSLDIVKQLLEHDYPETVKKDLIDEFNHCEFSLAIPVYSEDAENKTAFYLACEEGHVDIVEYMLRYKVRGRLQEQSISDKSFSYSTCSDDSDFVEIHPFQVKSKVEVSTGPLDIQSDNTVIYKRDDEGNYLTSCIFIAVKNRHRQVIEKLIEFGANLELYGTEKDVKYNVLLKQAIENNDLLTLNMLLKNHATDVNNFVFEETVRHKTRFISHMLQYKVSEDKVNGINKAQMEEDYEAMCTDSFNSNEQYESKFPKEAVNVRWQNLKVLSTVEKAWLETAARFINPQITSLNERTPLYAISRVDVSNNSLTMVPLPLLQLPSLVTLHLSNNEIREFPSQGKDDIDCKWLEELHINHNKLEIIPDYVFLLPKLRILNATNNLIKQLPAAMWQADSLNMVNLSNNLLENLPKPVYASVRIDSESSLPEDEDNSVNEEDVDKAFSSMESHVIFHNPKRASHWSRSLIVSEEEVKNMHNKKKGIRTLKLTANKINVFPDFLSCCCPNLENLELSKNKMQKLGNLAAYPVGLKTLDLSFNCLVSMEEWKEESSVKKCYFLNKGYVQISHVFL